MAAKPWENTITGRRDTEVGGAAVVLEVASKAALEMIGAPYRAGDLAAVCMK